MGTMIKTSSDVVSFLKSQHQDIKAMLEKVLSTSGTAREKAFFDLRRTIAVHETAEEEIVHPAARKILPNGNAIVEARLHEENQGKQALANLEKLEVNSAAFEERFKDFQKAVLAHAEAEEKEEFEKLGNSLEPARLESMRKAVELAESVAPTRPHPGIESQAANILSGPFASMVDRTRDAFSAKH
jgi:hemerythrin superfamily protein